MLPWKRRNKSSREKEINISNNQKSLGPSLKEEALGRGGKEETTRRKATGGTKHPTRSRKEMITRRA